MSGYTLHCRWLFTFFINFGEIFQPFNFVSRKNGNEKLNLNSCDTIYCAVLGNGCPMPSSSHPVQRINNISAAQHQDKWHIHDLGKYMTNILWVDGGRWHPYTATLSIVTEWGSLLHPHGYAFSPSVQYSDNPCLSIVRSPDFTRNEWSCGLLARGWTKGRSDGGDTDKDKNLF